MAIHTTVITIPCITARNIPQLAARSARSLSLDPRYMAITAFIPTPNPIATAFTKFCSGNTYESAVIASSLILATKKLSTILYKAFTIIDITIGSAMDIKSGNPGFSFIKFSFIKPPSPDGINKAPQPCGCGAKR